MISPPQPSPQGRRENCVLRGQPSARRGGGVDNGRTCVGLAVLQTEKIMLLLLRYANARAMLHSLE